MAYTQEIDQNYPKEAHLTSQTQLKEIMCKELQECFKMPYQIGNKNKEKEIILKTK